MGNICLEINHKMWKYLVEKHIFLLSKSVKKLCVSHTSITYRNTHPEDIIAALPTILFSEMCVKQYNNIWDLTSRVCKGYTKSYLCIYVARG